MLWFNAEGGSRGHLSASVALAKTRMLGRSLCTSKVVSVAFWLSGKKRTTGVSTRAAQSATAQQPRSLEQHDPKQRFVGALPWPARIEV